MSQALRKLAGTLNRTDTIAIFTNQLREKIGVMFGSPETTPGGRALKFYSSVRLDIRRIETLKEGAEAFGNRVRVKVVKNKVAPPFKQAEFDIIYGSGISWEGSVLDVGLERKIVTKSGSYFSLGDERLGQGRQNATAFLAENPDLVQTILARIQLEAGPDQIVSARLLPQADDAPRRAGRSGGDRGGDRGGGRWRRSAPRCERGPAARTRSTRPCARSRHAITLERRWRRGLSDAASRTIDARRPSTLLELSGYLDDQRFAQRRAGPALTGGVGNALIARRSATPGGAGRRLQRRRSPSWSPRRTRAERVAAVRGRTARTARLLARKGFAEESLEALVADLDGRTVG